MKRARAVAGSGFVAALTLAVLLGLFAMHGLGAHGVGAAGHGPTASELHHGLPLELSTDRSTAAHLAGSGHGQPSGAELCVTVLAPRGLPLLAAGSETDATTAPSARQRLMPSPRPCGRDPDRPSLEQLSVSRR